MLKRMLSWIAVPIAHAGEYTPDLPNPLGTGTDLTKIVDRVTDFVINFAIVVVPIVIIWGAFQMLTSGGQSEKWQSGKKAILYAVIGLIVVLLAKGISAAIKVAVTGKP